MCYCKDGSDVQPKYAYDKPTFMNGMKQNDSRTINSIWWK